MGVTGVGEGGNKRKRKGERGGFGGIAAGVGE